MYRCVPVFFFWISIKRSKHARITIFQKVMVLSKFCVSNLLLTSLLAGTDGPAEHSAGGLWARGEECLSSSGTSVVTNSSVSTGCIGVSDVERIKKNKNKRSALNPSRTISTLAALKFTGNYK